MSNDVASDLSCREREGGGGVRVLLHAGTSFVSFFLPSLPPYLVEGVGHAIEAVKGGKDGGVGQNYVDVRDEGAKLKLF